MSEYFLFKAEKALAEEELIKAIERDSDQKRLLTYILSAPLIENRYFYDFKDGFIVLRPKNKIAIVCKGNKNTEFDNYFDDILDDISSIADNYGLKSKIGRPRIWQSYFIKIESDKFKEADDFFSSIKLEENQNPLLVDVLIAMMLGSVANANSISIEPTENILDKVKHKIQIFDTDQSRFIYDDLSPEKRLVRIQGLSGTGKTELLLHKLKDLYVANPDSRICLTCHNKILAKTLYNRIKIFFNMMNVRTQIEWKEHLWCMHAWGSHYEPNSGTLSFICNHYNVPFMSLRGAGSFSRACEITFNNINKKIENGELDVDRYAFTFMFIDESQDFDENFFNLCDLVTEKRVYIAGDIFQSIFEYYENDFKYDYLLSRCYRTDPKTLMFAQAMGFGLFEERKLWWLDDRNWKLCGYDIEPHDNNVKLERKPLRRFEDIDPDFESIVIKKISNATKEILKVIGEIKNEFPTVKAEDIAIILIDKDNYIYDLSFDLQSAILERFNWESTIGQEDKERKDGQVFISNRNNVKGLEFPFVICFTSQIKKDYSYRNVLYTMLTRSFIRTYLLVQDNGINGLNQEMIDGLEGIMKNHHMLISRPSEEEEKRIKQDFEVANEAKSLKDRIETIFEINNLDKQWLEDVINFYEKKYKDKKPNEQQQVDFVISAYKLFSND